MTMERAVGHTSRVDAAALVISLLALLASGASALFSWRQAQAAHTSARIESERRVEEVEAREQTETEQKIAHVSLQLSPPTRNTQPTLLVRNAGPAKAENIRVTFDASDDGLSAPMTRMWSDLQGDLKPGESASAGAGLTAETTRRFRVTLEWIDGRGPQHETVLLRT